MTLVSLILSMVLQSSQPALALNKADGLARLQQLKSQHQSRLDELDERLSQALALNPVQDESFEKTVSDLSQQRRELRLRQNFIDRLILQIDSHYTGTDFRAFLQARLLEMAKADLTAVSREDQIWKFLTYLHRAIDTIPERNEDLLSFIEGYMNFASLSDPRSPKDFLQSRSYTNGKDSFAANALQRDQVGEQVENRLRSLEKDAAIEIRAKASEPPTQSAKE